MKTFEQNSHFISPAPLRWSDRKYLLYLDCNTWGTRSKHSQTIPLAVDVLPLFIKGMILLSVQVLFLASYSYRTNIYTWELLVQPHSSSLGLRAALLEQMGVKWKLFLEGKILLIPFHHWRFPSWCGESSRWPSKCKPTSLTFRLLLPQCSECLQSVLH